MKYIFQIAVLVTLFVFKLNGQTSPYDTLPSFNIDNPSSMAYETVECLNKNEFNEGSIRLFGRNYTFITYHNKLFLYNKMIFNRILPIDTPNNALTQLLFEISILDTPSLYINKCLLKRVMFDKYNFNTFSIKSSLLDTLEIYNSTIIDNFSIIDSSCKKLILEKNRFENETRISLSNPTIKYMSLAYSKLSGKVELDLMYLPDTLNFTSMDLSNLIGSIDLTRCKNRKGKKCAISLYGTDINKISLKFVDFKLYFPQDITYEDSLYVYQQLLTKLKSDGLEESFKKVDIEVRQIKYNHNDRHFLNWLDKTWWNYGYDKDLVVWNSIKVNFLFFFINILIFPNLLKKVYRNENIEKTYNYIFRETLDDLMVRQFWLLPYCFIYTSYIFWGLKLDFSKIQTKNLFLLAWILFQYMVGLICLAYIANFIVTK